jgi:hypothetical protein
LSILLEGLFGLVPISAAAAVAATAASAEATAATTPTAASAAITSTASATSPAAAAATTATTSAIPAAATASSATLFARAGFVDGEGAAVVLLAVQRRDCRVGFVVVGHLDKPEALASSSVAIVNDLGRNHLAMLSEQLLQFRAIDLVAQIPDIQLLTH